MVRRGLPARLGTEKCKTLSGGNLGTLKLWRTSGNRCKKHKEMTID